MVTIASLWLPILLSAVLVFVASSIIHMLLGYHANDFRPPPDEDAFLAALGTVPIAPGDYAVPYARGMEEMKSESYRAKVERGPVAFFTVVDPRTVFSMGPTMAQWFVYLLVVSIFPAYLASRMLEPGTGYLEVFRLTGTVTFAAYALALPTRSVWYKTSWATTAKSMFDALIYALLTAGIFGWLWPA